MESCKHQTGYDHLYFVRLFKLHLNWIIPINGWFSVINVYMYNFAICLQDTTVYETKTYVINLWVTLQQFRENECYDKMIYSIH